MADENGGQCRQERDGVRFRLACKWPSGNLDEVASRAVVGTDCIESIYSPSIVIVSCLQQQASRPILWSHPGPAPSWVFPFHSQANPQKARQSPLLNLIQCPPPLI